MSDPAEIRCACPCDGARACYRRRYALDLREMFDGGNDARAREDDGDEECSCSCHDEEAPDSEDDYDDWTGA